MSALYTKNGRPLQVSGNRIFNSDGLEVARLRNDRAYGPDGRYVGTVVNDRLVHRSTHGVNRFSVRSLQAEWLSPDEPYGERHVGR